MPTFAFWNVNGNVSPEMIAAFAHEQDADILILAENERSVFEIQRALNQDADRLYFPDPGESERLTILTRFQPDPRCLVFDGMHAAARHYGYLLGESLLMVAVHLPSKLRLKTEDQVFIARELRQQVDEAEGTVGHARTIVVGDFNMDPFESGIVGSGGLHAVMDRRIAARGTRIVRGRRHQFFYNPMWSKLGDADGSPSGTYFRAPGSDVSYFWHTLDQVLVRPALLAALPPDGVRIVTRVGSTDLLTKRGRPNREVASDHLPLVCRLADIQETIDGIEELVG